MNSTATISLGVDDSEESSGRRVWRPGGTILRFFTIRIIPAASHANE
ncbi:MAG: hypothetical protein O7B25_03545 [Gammaproteobacteria bacterium]|nr:hypothetical protein [Gammaproteobacteria bacterium]